MKNSKNLYLSKTLRRLRLKAGLTQQNMADALNINRSTYTYYETGKTTPDIYTIKVLAKVLEVEVEVLIDENTADNLPDIGKRRPTKQIKDIRNIDGLSSTEKTVVTLIRSAGLSEEEVKELIEMLRSKSR